MEQVLRGGGLSTLGSGERVKLKKKVTLMRPNPGVFSDVESRGSLWMVEVGTCDANKILGEKLIKN